jgi:hypothetical protein
MAPPAHGKNVSAATGESRRKNGEWRMENGDWRMEIGDWRLEIGDWRWEIGDGRWAGRRDTSATAGSEKLMGTSNVEL